MPIDNLVDPDANAFAKLNQVITLINTFSPATIGEVNSGSEAVKWVTPATLEQRRINRKANQTLVNQGTDDNQWVSPLTLEGKFAAKIASIAELNAGTAVAKYVAPDVLEARRINRKASEDDVKTGSDDDKWVSPARLHGKVYSEGPKLVGGMDGTIARPGLYPPAFTGNTEGGTSPADADGSPVTIATGKALRVTGDKSIVTRGRFPLFANLDWRGVVSLRRITDPVDPSGDSVQVRINWLSQAGNFISATRVFPVSASDPLTVADGRQSIEFTFGTSPFADYAPPSGATDATISVRHFGVEGDGQTDVEIVHVDSATGTFATDRVSAMEVAEVGYYAIDPAIAEIGDAVTPTVTWTINGTAAITSQVIRLTSIATTARSFTEPSPVAGTTIYTLRVTDHLGREKTAQIQCTFMRRMYWGVSASPTLSSAGVTGLVHSGLSDELALLAELSPTDEYIYVAVPRDLYDDNPPSEILIEGHDEGPNMVVTLVSVTGLATSNYRVVRSLYKLTGTNIQIEVKP